MLRKETKQKLEERLRKLKGYAKKIIKKKQKPDRLDTFRNLQRKFLKTVSAVSYSVFARLAPFWSVTLNVLTATHA